LKIETCSTGASQTPGDWLVVFVAEGPDATKLTGPLGDRVEQLRKRGDFEGKRGETLALYESLGTSAQRILLVGLGKADSMAATAIARATGTAIRTISKKGAGTVILAPAGESTAMDTDSAVAAQVTGAIIAAGTQEIFRTTKKSKPLATLMLPDSPRAENIAHASMIAQGVRWAAEMVNLPPEEIYPETFCQRAIDESASLPIRTEVLGLSELAALKMACILGVGRGSQHEPRLLVMRYAGAPTDPRQLALVGKGITFDSGGLSIKTAEGMLTMKCDMAGAAAAVAATIAVARLALPVNILTLAPLAENMPSSTAIRPGDILRAKNGKTIEVVNTDAEGRLVLADALSHAVDLGATHIVDLATLTGACLVALGTSVAGMMSNNDEFAGQVDAAAKHVGERLWRLPLDDDYEELIRSGIADMKNSGGRYGGTITAAKLLQHFVAERPWVHLDIAGPAFAEKETPYQDAGGTGFGVRTLVELAKQFASKTS
jgi:leucyl aminopeptidase